MASELDYIIQFVTFLAKWVQHYLLNTPQVVAILLLVLVATIISWNLLTQQSKTVHPATSILLALLILASMVMEQRNNREVARLEVRLAEANKTISQGSIQADELLESLKESKALRQEEANPLDGCLHVFIDLGSNRGIQIRKLYEPHVFPLAPIQPLYERYFGKHQERDLREICSVSFEPNSKHAAGLEALVDAYASCGITVVLYKAGVGHKNTRATFGHFNSFFGHEIGNDAAARLIDENATKLMAEKAHDEIVTEEVDVMRFATFLTEVVAKRKLPRSASVKDPKVVIKSDIEGAELKILPDLLVTGALAQVDNIHMEWHGESYYNLGREASMVDKLAKAITAVAELTQREDIEGKFDIEEMDDETYSSVAQFRPWGDYSDLPLLVC